MTLKCKW